MRFFLLATATVLSGCVTDLTAAHYNNCEIAYSKWVEKAECMDSVAATDLRIAHDPISQEIVAYRRLLIENVKKNKMSDAEANYAFKQKISEKNQSVAFSNYLNAPSYPVVSSSPPAYPTYQRPIETQCRPTIGGGFDCKTQETGPDLSVFGRQRSMNDYMR
jgi:hypothetical protein